MSLTIRYAGAALTGLAFASALPCQAAPRDEAYASFQRCNAISDDRIWLDCIYGAVQPVRAQLHLPSATDAQVRLVPQAPVSGPVPAARPIATAGITHPPARKEGFLSYVLGGRNEVEGVPFRSYQFDRAGYFTVTLANDQVWRQMDSDHHMASWKADPGRYVATIKTGALGSSILQVRGVSGAFMVEQVP